MCPPGLRDKAIFMSKRVYRFAGVLLLAMGLSASYAKGDIYYTGYGNNPNPNPSNPNIFDLLIVNSGTYFISAAGAQGGGTASDPTTGLVAQAGGLGAVVGGYVTLYAGEELAIVVGGQGDSGRIFYASESSTGPTYEFSSGGGGGGGSFVYLTSSDGAGSSGSNPLLPLMVAGGGGGAGGTTPGGDGQILNAQPGSGGDGGAAGTNGNGGVATTGGTNCSLLPPPGDSPGDCGGGAGAGWLSAGGSGGVRFSNGFGGQGGPCAYAGCDPSDPSDLFSDGSGAFHNGGGYGGGGGGGLLGGGGGGGYSGGGGGCGQCGAGGGGGASYEDPSFSSVDPNFPYSVFTNAAGANSGDGYVIVEQVPEPSSVVLLLTELLALACVGFVFRKRIARSNR
jgi:hypothetical protein